MTSSRKVLLAVALACGLVSAARKGRADEASELERGKMSYDAGRYAEGADRFKELLNPDAPGALREPSVIERARAYYAACLIALGRNEDANTQIEKVFRQDPLFTPDPVIFPGKVIDRFLDVKSRLKGEIEDAFRARAEADRAARAKVEREQRAYLDSLQRLAGQESIVVRHSRWIAAVPFGAGQFQNGQEGLGYAFLVTEAILAGTSITAGIIHMQLTADYPKYEKSINFDDFESRWKTTLDINRYATVALAAVMVGGIVHAQVTFVPEVKELRPRPIPKPPAVMPTIGALPQGLVLGVSGAF